MKTLSLWAIFFSLVLTLILAGMDFSPPAQAQCGSGDHMSNMGNMGNRNMGSMMGYRQGGTYYPAPQAYSPSYVVPDNNQKPGYAPLDQRGSGQSRSPAAHGSGHLGTGDHRNMH